ncbi:MAG: asparaginase [Gemmatimonadota bacterium]
MKDRIAVLRGAVEESSHAVHAAVVDAHGRTVASVGDPDRVTFFRSSAKPLQALPLVEDGVADRFGFTAAELAICCASHGAEPRHVALVQGMLDRLGLSADALECGAHPPMHGPSAEALVRSGRAPGRIHNNCSGKHTGMLALALHHGWDPSGYAGAEHPVQRRMRTEVARWSARPAADIPVAVDGCGVSCFALPVRDMAAAYARFAAQARQGGSARRIVDAMTTHPWAVAGEGRLCTDLMAQTEGRLFAKVGAEGVYGAGAPAEGLGIGLKVEDGGWRAAGVALLAVLDAVGLLSEDDRSALEGWAHPPVHDTRGEVVGRVEPALRVRGRGVAV